MKETKKIRQKEITEIQKDLNALREKLFKLNLERETGSLKKNHQIQITRRKIARLLTILKEKQQDYGKNKKKST